MKVQATPTNIQEKVYAMDLSFVEKRLIEKNGMSVRKARRAIKEYRDYLCQTVSTDVFLSPSKIADEAWHAHILFLARYITDCMNTFGRIIYHLPLGPSKEPLGSYKECASGGDCRVCRASDGNCGNCWEHKSNEYHTFTIMVPAC